MNFIEVPNLPEKQVCLAVADGRISAASETALDQMGVKVLKTMHHPGLYEAVSCHPDMGLHHTGRNRIVHAPGIGRELEYALEMAGFRLIRGDAELTPKYPGDIAYNAARVGRFCFHNLKYTDPVLRRELENEGVELVHVEQGYTKCSTAIIDENTIITSDAGIARAAEVKGIQALLIPPLQNILLPGLDYGFIGGATGLICKSRLAVNGNAEKLKSFETINSLLSLKNGDLISLSDHEITDIGSLIPLMTL